MIEIDAKQLEHAEAVLRHIPGGVEKAIVAALNRSAEGARTAAVKKVRERYYVKAGDVSKTIKIHKASPNNPFVIIRSTGSPMALSKFSITPTKPQPRRKKPIAARVLKSSGKKIIPGAFVAKMDSGHIGVFFRVGRSRLPIQQRYGPSVPQMLGHSSVVTHVEEMAKERLEERLNHEIERLLRGIGK